MLVRKEVENMLDKIALSLLIVGGLNWGLVGIFKFDLVAWLFGGQGSVVSRIIYTVVGLAGLWCITMLFRKLRREALPFHTGRRFALRLRRSDCI